MYAGSRFSYMGKCFTLSVFRWEPVISAAAAMTASAGSYSPFISIIHLKFKGSSPKHRI